ncbi:thioredoxin family protein [Massilia antarctica]|uniref:thioredoxin family protein n=1 Tax=Massilia antarctica TaxID=2765360 RepID=UPI0006BB9552|nr:thioredoxin family protein [Massilia sp. H27-R4]MCY0915238.1 thioredoxin family protein [Massilia sp. H27-R4]CUI05707.1 DipZ protein [Janthinobacterium sp. CG23_2]CUU29493.1 DipZ protein [Janthinobacterium sp. CG23_2]
MNRYSLAALAIVAAFGVATLSMTAASHAATSVPYRSDLPVQGAMPGFDGAATWLNSAPLTPAQLRGKVVLVDFWTYSCINCIRTMPYVRAWHDKYRGQGLAVVGVHTPEFKFEADQDNVNAAVARFRIDFPVALDSDRRIWQAWRNRAWPALYLVDANGRIRYRQLGEGGYDKLERAIQSLLAEARGGPVDTALVAPPMHAEQLAPDLRQLDSAETYVGYSQATNFRSPEPVRPGMPQQYSVGALALNQWGLSGPWTVHAESAVAGQAGSGIVHQFSARDLHLVMGAGARGRQVRIKVTLDGRAPGADHGADIDADGNGLVTDTRLYQLIRQSGSVRQRRIEIRFLDNGADVYAFTFG